jgi:hypothetical protein
MEENDILGEQILEIVQNQLKANDPPETRLTFDRLLEEGYTEIQIKQMIASCVMVEIYDVLVSGKEFDEERYIRNLKKLPKGPFRNE